MLSLLNPQNKIRDPIHGYIWLTDQELDIIDTPIFQRLRRISQLALTKYVYPTAENSRFVHSLGVLQAATNIFAEVIRFNPELWDGEKETLKYNLQILRIAALLHDIGHMPFSHAAETYYLGKDKKIKHEEVGKNIIENCPDLSDKIKKIDISPKVVSSLVKGKCTVNLNILKKFISDEFDADRADFLLRDSYFCGVKYGEYDYLRYAGSFRFVEDDEGRKIFAIEKGNTHTVEAFLLARYHYYLQVPFHRTRKGYDKALERYFLDLEERNKIPHSGITRTGDALDIDFKCFQQLDDFTIFELIKKDYEQGNPWAKILMRQDRLHPIFETEKDSSANKQNFLDLLVCLDEAGLKENDDYFTFKRTVPVHSILKTTDEEGEVNYPVVDKRQENKIVGTIIDYSPLLSSTKNKPAYIRRIYITTEAKKNEKVRKAIQEYKDKIKQRELREKGEG